MAARLPKAFLKAGKLFSKRPHKYNAKRTKVDGYTFDSQAEANRYGELKMLLLGHKISELNVHPLYPLNVNGKHICNYEADFSYLEPRGVPPKIVFEGSPPMHNTITTVRVIEDVKGVATGEYKIKRNLFLALYPDAEFRELGSDANSVRKEWEKALEGRVTAARMGGA